MMQHEMQHGDDKICPGNSRVSGFFFFAMQHDSVISSQSGSGLLQFPSGIRQNHSRIRCYPTSPTDGLDVSPILQLVAFRQSFYLKDDCFKPLALSLGSDHGVLGDVAEVYPTVP